MTPKSLRKPRILLADNAITFANTCAEFLEMHGYHVQRAYTQDECQRALKEGSVHLAILDLRMGDDHDEKDESGLILARQSNPRIPKIILTAFPTWEMARESLIASADSLPPAVSFVSKLEGLEVLLQHVKRTFENYSPINWDLQIDWTARDPFSLVRIIQPDLDYELLTLRAGEYEDLFRRIFYQADQIKVDELLWSYGSRVALKVFAFSRNKLPESMVVICGPRDEMKSEIDRFRDYAPLPKANYTDLYRTEESTHFAANAYRLVGCDMESVRTFGELYRAESAKSLSAAIAALCEQPLGEWTQEKRVLSESQTIDEIYRDKFGLSAERFDRATIAACIQSLVRRLHTLGLDIEQGSAEITMRFNNSSFSYPDPGPFVNRQTTIGDPVLLVNSPGVLTSDNTLIDRNNNVWVTDFSVAGLAPIAWNYVSLEAAIRFDLLEIDQFWRLHEIERCLTEEDFSRFDHSYYESRLHKPLRAIQQIRRLAARESGQNIRSYHLGIFFHAMSRLLHAPLSAHAKNREIMRAAHLLISAGIISKLLAGEKTPAQPSIEKGEEGIRIDAGNFEASIEGRRVRLTGQELKLLNFLYSHANQLCTRDDIVIDVFEHKYDETDESQEDLVNTAISRLRQKIEPDPKNPRYIRNERGRGYRFVIKI